MKLAAALLAVGLFSTACSSNTRYANGFSDDAFATVEGGASRAEIEGKLGQPLKTEVIYVKDGAYWSSLGNPEFGAGKVHQHIYHYSAPTDPKRDYQRRIVVFDVSGHMQRKEAGMTD